jgi:uncharacterized protein involved in exopolysaccharide biosynthesis
MNEAAENMKTPAPMGAVIELSKLIAVVRSKFWWLALVVFVVTALGAVYAFTATRFYSSEAQLVINRTNMPAGGLSALANQVSSIANLSAFGLGANSERGETIALLKSRSLAQRVIEKHNLMDVLFPPSQRKAGDKPPTMWRAVRKFTSGVMSVDEDRLTGVITVTCEWTDAKTAADWVNLVVAEANLVSRERAIADAERGIGFLQEELKSTQSLEVREAIYRLIEAQMSQRMLANVRADYVVRVIDPATVADWPSRPRRLLVVAGSVLFGGFIAAVIVLVLAARMPSVGRPGPGA